MRAETGSSRPSVWDDRPRIDKAGQNRRSDGWKSLEDMHEFFVEQMFKQGKKVVYALKEIRAGDQFEVEIYPQFKKMDEVPPEGRSIKKDNDKAQRNLNDKNARKYVERLINENFTDRDLWLTFTYDNEHLPPEALSGMQFILL